MPHRNTVDTSSNAKINILIVDDRPDGLMALEAVLASPEYNLVQADSGEQALSRVLEYQFALILLDVQMPGMDGFETARVIKQREKSKDIPIIFVTAISKETTFVYKGYATGAVDYIFKPFDPHILKSKVAVYVDLFRKNLKIQQQSDLIREGDRRARLQQLAALEVENLSRYRNLADSIPHIVWKSQPDGTLDYCNKVWTSYTGLTLEQSIGSGWQRAMHADDLTKLFALWTQALKEGQAFEAECRIRLAETGEYKWHLFKAVPEKFPAIDSDSEHTLLAEQQVVAWVATSTDIDSRKKMERELVCAKDEAMKASNAKTNFLANMSHEIRTPLGIVLGYSELMADPQLSDIERKHHLATVKHNGTQLSDLIGDILDLSKIESGHLDIESRTSSLPDILNGVLKPLELKAKEKNVGLKLELLSKVPDQILTDPTRLRQILFNVIGNAIKFTSKGDVIVRLNYIPAEAMLVMDVNDSGIGITPAQEEKIFNPFMQADASTTRKFGGTGLGLSLSRKLATALGGDIELTWSEFGKGSTFRVTIKVAEVTNTRLIDANEIVRSESQSVSRSKPADQCLTGLTVLLVEDSAENQMLISRFIRLAGAVVVTASNGAEAVDAVHLRLAQNQNFDLVLMDIQMPVMDGYEATRTLRHEGFKAPIIALTAHAFEEERHRCIQAGCNEHLTKPVNRDLLVSTIFNYATVMKSKPAGVNKSGVLGTEIVADPTLKPDPVLGP